MSEWTVVGIDPAPTKDAVIHRNGAWSKVAPGDLRRFVTKVAADSTRTLIAWDAPLSFGPTDLYDRRVDKVARAWAKRHVAIGHFGEKAINARPFAGLPHWVVTCEALGLPFGTPPSGLRLVHDRPANDERFVAIEVHPAMALGAWWIEARRPDSLPRYKGSPGACRMIAAALGFPDGAGEDDDALDAFVACRLGELFLNGGACCVGDSQTGGYVMPQCSATSELLDALASC